MLVSCPHATPRFGQGHLAKYGPPVTRFGDRAHENKAPSSTCDARGRSMLRHTSGLRPGASGLTHTLQQRTGRRQPTGSCKLLFPDSRQGRRGRSPRQPRLHIHRRARLGNLPHRRKGSDQPQFQRIDQPRIRYTRQRPVADDDRPDQRPRHGSRLRAYPRHTRPAQDGHRWRRI